MFTVLTAFLLLAGCSEEKTFVFTAYESRNVDFVAVNECVKNENTGGLDTAYSAPYDYYEEYEPREVRIPVYTPNIAEYGYEAKDYTHSVDRRNELWAGGYSEMTFIFRPSCPEEKEARFTMPDGEVAVVTAANPVCRWVLDYEAWNNIVQDWVVKAESEYKIGDVVYRNIGYVFIEPESWVRYNPVDGRWYESDWTSNPNLEIQGNVDFMVENLTAGSNDWAESQPYNGYYYDWWTGVERGEKFWIDVYDPEGTYDGAEVRLGRYHHLWAGGNNELKVTFRPLNEDDVATFTMPDGKVFDVTAQNTSFVWTINHEAVAGGVEWYDYQSLLIKAEGWFSSQGVQYSNQGYVFVNTMVEDYGNPVFLQFNAADGKWYFNNWIENAEIEATRN